MHTVPGGTTPVSPLGHCHVSSVRHVMKFVPPQACPPREGATPVQSTWRGRSGEAGVGVALLESAPLHNLQMKEEHSPGETTCPEQ